MASPLAGSKLGELGSSLYFDDMLRSHSLDLGHRAQKRESFRLATFLLRHTRSEILQNFAPPKMSAAHRQLSLSTPVEDLKKSCICLHGSRRCTRKRYQAKSDVTYDTLLDDMTLNWDDLDNSEQATAAQRFADFSVCGTCMKESHHHDVQAEFLREKAAMSVVSPSRQQRDASIAPTTTSPQDSSPAPHSRSSSPDLSTMLERSNADGDGANAVPTSEADLGSDLAEATCKCHWHAH